MIDPPKTKEQAEREKYGPPYRAIKYNPSYCAYRVWTAPRWGGSQCSRKPGHGPANLYCKQHAKKV